ncbi:class I SAM-dependent methyltransferase [Hydrogenophaga sp.]|uniref:class I SAM-dependent methyltransferase n=1 Tax=Hydrogenophaga sp. TaxID=1904254 RepID=UPI00271D9EF8|nr:rRNA adenine N-6-methyltransferase family protein [Hydrogenophaga sp.]MDO8904628.1 rRNA adenine N-6-methyltransferase family protein [Hydrogenophaga sp.]
MRQRLAFALGYLRNPRHVGAIAPASRALAQAILAEVLRNDAQVLIEVGAGTGAITRALMPALDRLDRFLVIERDPGFARMLSAHFPELEVLNCCASSVDQLPLDASAPVTLVSSLPLLSMPKAEVQKCVSAMLSLMTHRPGSKLIQYTYAAPHLRPFANIPYGWRWRRVVSIWANLPPATVWSLEQTPRGASIVH